MTNHIAREQTAINVLEYLARDVAPHLVQERGGTLVPKADIELELIIDRASQTLRAARVYSPPKKSRSLVDVAATELAMIQAALLGVTAQAMTGLTRTIFFDHDLYYFLHELEGHARSQGDTKYSAEEVFKKYEAGRDLVRHVLCERCEPSARSQVTDA